MNTEVDKPSLINAYNLLVKGIEQNANNNSDRAYGGLIRAGKGLLVENLCRHIIEIAWRDLGNPSNRLSFEKKAVRIPIRHTYVNNIVSPEVKEYIMQNIRDYYYLLKTDIHVSIDGKFIMGVECKAYTENAMLKRILVDFTLLKTIYPSLSCFLFQLESQLGGDYSAISKDICFGSSTTHTLLSYFNVDLNIITLLDGERKVDKPIHKVEYYKELTEVSIDNAICSFQSVLGNY